MKKLHTVLLHPLVLLLVIWYSNGFYTSHLLKQADVKDANEVVELATGNEYIKQELDVVRKEHERIKQRQLEEQKEKQARVDAIRTYLLEIRSPLYNKADYFVYISELYDIDWWLLPSICVAESGCGKNVHRRYNPFGWGQVEFLSWEDAIETVGRQLRYSYYDKGCSSLRCIWRVYNGGYDNWWRNVIASKVRLEELYLKYKRQ